MITIDIQAITPDMVRSVYSGKRGKCMCGCAGNHRYNPAHREEGSKDRGYAVADDEVNMAQVTRVLRLIQAEPEAKVDDAGFIYADVGNRSYVAYLTAAASAQVQS